MRLAPPTADECAAATVIGDYANLEFKRWIRLICIWCYPIALVGTLLMMVPLAHFVPPPSPAFSAAHIAHIYDSNLTGIRIALVGAMFSTALLLPYYTAVSAELRKIEGRPGILSAIQFAGGIILVTEFLVMVMLLFVASFRPTRDPQIIQALNDFWWFVWTAAIPLYIANYICVAIVAFMDKRPKPTWPRWAAYLNAWNAVLGTGGVLVPFFKHGPFAWDGIVGFWIPVLAFAAVNLVNVYLLLRAPYDPPVPRNAYEAAQRDQAQAAMAATGLASASTAL